MVVVIDPVINPRINLLLNLLLLLNLIIVLDKVGYIKLAVGGIVKIDL